MDTLLKIVQTINAYLSDYILIILLIGVGLFYTIKTRFVQVRCFGEGWRKMFGNFSLKGGSGNGGMSSFQALSTAIAAQVGTGNIVGACGAILIGGPRLVFSATSCARVITDERISSNNIGVRLNILCVIIIFLLCYFLS